MRTAAAKGVSQRAVILKHGLKNALIPLVTVIALSLPGLVAGAVVTETIFAWPGVGRLAITAILQRDYPVVQGCVLLVAVVFVLINLLVDVLYGWLDPRIRYE
jgi:peptide/nickel transport system permease protein